MRVAPIAPTVLEFSSAAAEAASGRKQVMCHRGGSCKHCKGTEAALGTSKTPETQLNEHPHSYGREDTSYVFSINDLVKNIVQKSHFY